LSYDWPIFAAHVILFACLLPMSVIDLEHYWVDVRFTNLATVAGFALHTLWTPRHSTEWTRPWDATAVMSIFALAALGIVWLIFSCQPHTDRGDPEESSQDEETSDAMTSALPRSLPPSLVSPSRAVGWVAAALLLALAAALFADEALQVDLRHTGRALLPLVLLFALIVWESSATRQSDKEIIDAINEERHGARRMVLAEFLVLLPVALAAALGIWIMQAEGELPGRISGALHAAIRVPGIPMMRSWTPLYGLATAATGYIIAGAVGWALRIVFTLVFGKEAFGSGDIHLMAAAGCVAGWPVVVLGFFLTCILAMIGWVATLPFKRTRALPLGPWLSLSFLTVVLFYDSIIELPFIARAISTFRLLFLDNSQVSLFESVR
jgi:prepilin signal peptidase PulO-like enzyme (type II secretory pathway)